MDAFTASRWVGEATFAALADLRVDREPPDDGDLRRLKSDIQMFGQLEPVDVIREEGGLRVVDGRKRIAALRWLGVRQVQVRVLGGSRETVG